MRSTLRAGRLILIAAWVAGAGAPLSVPARAWGAPPSERSDAALGADGGVGQGSAAGCDGFTVGLEALGVLAALMMLLGTRRTQRHRRRR